MKFRTLLISTFFLWILVTVLAGFLGATGSYLVHGDFNSVAVGVPVMFASLIGGVPFGIVVAKWLERELNKRGF